MNDDLELKVKVPQPHLYDECVNNFVELLLKAKEESREIIESRSLVLANWYLCRCLHLKFLHINDICILCLNNLHIQCRGFRHSFNLRIDFSRLEKVNGNSRESRELCSNKEGIIVANWGESL